MLSNKRAGMMGVVAKDVHIPTPAEILRIRTKLGLTQTEAAQRVGVGQGVWSAWESGTRRPSRQSAILIDLLRQKKI